MGKLRYIKIITIIALAAPATFIAARVGDTDKTVIPSRTFTVASIAEVIPAIIEEPKNIFSEIENKIIQCDEKLSILNLRVDSKELNFHEDRIVRTDTGISQSRKKLSDHPREIGLCLLNSKTGDVHIVTIATKILGDGVQIINPTGYEISIVPRDNGIKWNYWNTLYEVKTPEDLIVIRNSFPLIESGKVTNFLYTPYSPDIHNEDLIKTGKGYIETVVAKAFQNLRDKKVYSRAYPGELVSSVSQLKTSFFQHLPLLEQGDLTEFIFNPQNTVERTLVLVATNRNQAFAKTCNGSNACGWIQFTPPTYKSIKTIYKDAQLMPDFKDGAADHINVMMAAILLYDYNLTDLINRFGNTIAEDPRLEEYLAASYNGAPRWAHQSLSTALLSGTPDWTSKLKTETKGFMAKLRFIRGNGF